MKKLLFTGGGGSGSEAIMRLLNKKYVIHFADADISKISPSIKKDYKHSIPYAEDKLFLPELIKICNNLEIDYLFPGVDEELITIAKSSKQFLSTELILPSLKFIRTNLNKLKTAEYYRTKNIKVPKTQVLSDYNYHIEPPLISKPKEGRGSRNVIRHKSNNEITHLQNILSNSDDYIIQEAINGQEFTVQMISDKNSNLRAVVPVKLYEKSGITISGITENEKNVISTCKEIHKAYPTPGIYNIQLILTDNKEAIPFEINPRISTTFCLVLYSLSVDPIELFLNENKTQTGIVNFKEGIRLDRYWYNHFSNEKV